MNGKDLEKALLWEAPHIGEKAPEQIPEAQDFCEGYKTFLNEGKTERECVKKAVTLLENAGYQKFDPKASYKAGDKIYWNNRKKAIIASTIGTKDLNEGLRMNGAHIDSPRLDLKPNPLFEKDEIAYLKPHYYGGIRKYQWGTVPLSMHGVVVKADGEVVEISIGENEGDPQFCVTDLLPHLASEQNGRKLAEGLKGEELNIIIGSIPYHDEENEKIKNPAKLLAMKLLNERYGITEKDFTRAEIEMVPAYKAVDIGLDRGLVGAYGQDDRVCAYTALMAEIGTKKVMEEQDPSQAAVASRTAGELYGMEVLAEEVNNVKGNTTRFLILGKEPVYAKKAGKISVAFEIPHKSGSLYNILGNFIFNNVNMMMIESRPIPEKSFEYRFFVDFEGNLSDAGVRNALTGIAAEASVMRILGNY